MSLFDRFPHRVSILRATYQREAGTLGNYETNEAVATGVHAWIQNASMQEIIEWQKRDEAITNRVIFKADPGLEVGDKIQVESGTSFVGDVFVHKAVEDRSAGLGVIWTSLCEVER